MVWGELRNWCEYFCTIGLSLILQSIGFFVPNWVTTETCDAIGLFYRCCGKNDTGCVVDGADTYLNKAVLGFQATSFTIMVLAAISFFCMMSDNDDDDDDDDDDDKENGCLVTCLSFIIVLYPISGLCSVIGCIVLATKYSTSELSWGFYLSVTAGCYVILLTMCLCCVIIKAANGSGTTQVHRQSHTQAELHERHEIVEVKGMVFLPRIRVFRMFHISGIE